MDHRPTATGHLVASSGRFSLMMARPRRRQGRPEEKEPVDLWFEKASALSSTTGGRVHDHGSTSSALRIIAGAGAVCWRRRG